MALQTRDHKNISLTMDSLIHCQHLWWIGHFWAENTPKIHGGFNDKKYISKFMKICKIWAMLMSFFASQGFFSKDPIVWVDWAGPPPKYDFALIDNAIAGSALFVGNTLNVHGVFIGTLCLWIRCKWIHLSGESYTHQAKQQSFV